MQEIQEILPVPTDQKDVLRWTPATNGNCSTKNIYRYLAQQQVIQLPSQGSRSINQHASHILRSAWKMKDLPPLIKTFTWRLIRRALATAQRVSRYSSNIEPNCAYCGMIENDVHLFFHCELPTAVWSILYPNINLNNLPTDGIQLILPYVMPNTLSKCDFAKILIILWFIWKARNDKHFQRKSWSAVQVIHTVQAFISTTTLASTTDMMH